MLFMSWMGRVLLSLDRPIYRVKTAQGDNLNFGKWLSGLR